MAAVLFPWPTRAERKAQVEAARRKAEQAQRQAAAARGLTEEMQEILAKNHLAQSIADGLIQARLRQRGRK